MTPPPGPLHLHLAAERDLLSEVMPEYLTKAPGLGAWARTRVGGVLSPDRLAPLLENKVAGQPRPDWADGSDGSFRGQMDVCFARDLVLAPRHGVLIEPLGRVFASTAGEMLSWKPDLAALPAVRVEGEARVFRPPAGVPRIERATVFMAKGGTFNYGHYLLDCLPSLLAVHELGLTRDFAPVAPPLTRWNRELLGMAFPGLKVRELRQPLVRVGEAVFPTSLDHFLHRPNRIVLDLRDRILAGGPPASPAKRVYVSRRAYPMRVMVNEAALEAALEARGFTVVRAEALSVSQQVALMRGAEVVVGATGAGLANALLTPTGAKVFEILPEGFTSPWLRNLIHLAGGDWHGYFCPAPVDPREVSWRYRIRRGFRWGYRLPLEDFLRFLDERI